MPERNGRGLFAAALLRRFPTLPVEEEGRLTDPRLRENFIERVFAYRRLKDLFQPRLVARRAGAVSHRAQDGAAGAFDDALQRARPAGGEAERDAEARACATEYETAFMATLAIVATPRRHTNVLMHMADT